MNILKGKYIFLDKNLISRDETLNYICQKAEELGIITSETQTNVFNSFINRENESTTGFEDGFAIPHAISSNILEPAIIFIRLKSGVDWYSIDNKPTKFIIALFIPENQRSSSHMDVLSSIAVGLLNDNFKQVLINSKNKNEILETFIKQINFKKEESNFLLDSEAYKVLAITACPVGIAHTYLAAENIDNACKKLNILGKVSTHGSVGIKNDFTPQEIKDAEIIIIASDIGIDTSRFVGKKIYQTNIKPAIKDPKKLIDDAFKMGKIMEANDFLSGNSSEDSNEKKQYFVKHLLAGVSYMIPFIIFGGLMIAIALGLGKAIYSGGEIPPNTFLFYMLKFGETAFGLMIAILGGYIANSIAGRSAIAPAMIVSLIANSTALIFPLPGIEAAQTPLGFIGAILFGVLIGYTVKWMNSWTIHKNLASLMPIFIIPLGVTVFYGLLSVFIIGAPIAFIMDKFGEAMATVFQNNENSNIGVRVGIGIGMGLLIGSMAGFDMGGPINKIAFVMSAALLTLQTPIQNPMGMMAAAIPVAPMAMGISTMVYKKYFTKEQRGLGISALIMGTIGISEGAIPFAIADPKRVFIANIAGSAVAGAIAGALGVTGAVAHGGPIIALLGGISGNFIGDTATMQAGLGITFFFLAIIIVTVLVYGLLLKYVKDKNKQDVKEKNSFSTFLSKTKNSYNNSSFIQSYRTKDKKIIAFSIIFIFSIVLLIIGITLLSVSGARGELSNFINGTNLPKPIPPLLEPEPLTFPILSMYGFFCLVSGTLITFATIFYSFTAFPKKTFKSTQESK